MAHPKSINLRIRRFLAYLGAVMRHTKALIFGFISGGLVSLPAWIKPVLPNRYEQIVDSWSKTLAEPTTYWYLAVVCVLIGLFWASFLAWNEERDEQLATAEKNRPDFILTIGQLVGYELAEPERTIVLLSVEVVNKGADSSMLRWKARYDSPTLKKDVEIFRMSDEIKLPLSAGGVVVLKGIEAIYNKTTPIPRGGFVVGRLPIVIEGHRMIEINEKSALLTVGVLDYTGKSYLAYFQSKGPDADFSFLPGEGATVIPRAKQKDA
jgi:hypothetical protein